MRLGDAHRLRHLGGCRELLVYKRLTFVIGALNYQRFSDRICGFLDHINDCHYGSFCQ
ncbi:hypothetical protein D3C76_1081370 [compost metagenome]